jgi:uncharacterized protein
MRTGIMTKLFLTKTFILFFLLSHAQDQRSLLWKIERKNSDQVSYLFGTMHSRDKRVFNLDTALVPLILKSSLYVPEADLENVQEENFVKLMLPDGRTLRDIFTEEQYNFIKKEFEKTSSKTLEELNRLQPFALFMFLEESSPYFLPLTLDEYLYHAARDGGIPIHGLESAGEQISFLAESQRPGYIYDYFKNIEKYELLHNELQQAYIDADDEKLLRIVNDSSLAGFDMDILINKRNQQMTSRIDSIAKRHTAFFAIGAAHLFGENGVISGLSKAGYVVTPVCNKKKMHQLMHFDISWKNYQSFNGNFTLKFPDTPAVQKKTGENVFSSDFIHNKSMSMTFMVNEKINASFNSVNNETMAKMLLYSLRSSFTKSLGFTALMSRSFEFQGHYANETIFDCKNGIHLMHVRFILVHDRVYILSVLVKHNTEDLASIQEFMESFTILK